MVVYKYMCRCDCWYEDRTSLRLQDRMNQHISKSIGNNFKKTTKILPKRNCKEQINTLKSPQCDSAIRLHLLQNKEHAATITKTSNFRSLPGQEVHFIVQHWKPFKSKLLTPPILQISC